MRTKEDNVSNIIAINPQFGISASGKINDMLFEINQANEIYKVISQTAQSDAIKGGFAAETFHSETFNLDAILKDRKLRAYTDNYKNSPLAKNHSVSDIVVVDGTKQVHRAQVKYYRTAEATAKAGRELKDGVAKYKENDTLLVPSDQVEEVRKAAQKMSSKNQGTRPATSEAALEVKNKASDTLKVDGVESKSLTKRQAEQIGKGTKEGKDFRKDIHDQYLNKSTIQQSLRAAGSAAIMTSVIAGTINSFHYLKLVQDGKMSVDEATYEIIKNTSIAAADSALKAGASTAAISQLTRNFPQLFMGTTFKRSLSSSGVGAVIVCVIELVKNCTLCAAGKITTRELEERTGKSIYQGGAGAVGASIGASIGAAGGPIGMLVGGVLGAIITTLAMDIAVDNKIEKPFRENLANTQKLVETGDIMESALTYLTVGTAFYEQFDIAVQQSEASFERQIRHIQKQSISLREKINKL